MSLLSARGLAVRFGGVQALQGVDFDLDAGPIRGVIGPNGAGKTTFVNLLSGLIRPTAGTLVFDGRTGGPWPIATAVRLGIVRTFQQTRAFQGLSVRENLAIAARGAGGRELDRLIDGLGLEPELDRLAADLPYAALRRLGIALALALRPKLLMLDEPAVGLTEAELARMAGIIRRCRDDGVAILLIEHNMRFLMSLADQVTVFERGRILFEGSPAECQSHPGVIDAYLGRGGADAA